MSSSTQIRVREEAPRSKPDSDLRAAAATPPGDDTLQALRDALARLNSTPGEYRDPAELARLLNDAQGALDRARVVARALSHCEESVREARFDQAFEALDAAVLAYPGDPALVARRRDVETRRSAFEAAAAVRGAITEAQWLLEQDRPDLAARFLGKKAAELPGEPELLSQLGELEARLRQWEQNRQVRAALERAQELEAREQWPAALTVLEEALQSHPADPELTRAARRVKQTQADHERRKKLARRLELIGLRLKERSWSQALALLASAEKEFAGAAELVPLRREAEAGLRRSECEAVITEVRQSLADGELKHAEQLLQRGLSSFGPEPSLAALRSELESEKEYREGLRSAQVLFGRRQLQEAESILARLVMQDRPEAQALLETVRRTRTASDEEKFFNQGRESAIEMMQRGEFAQAADVLRNLLSLFPGNPILERDLRTAESAVQRKSPPAPAANGEENRARPAVAEPVFQAPAFGSIVGEASSSRPRRTRIVGAVALAAVAAGGVIWQFSGSETPTPKVGVKPALTTTSKPTAPPSEPTQPAQPAPPVTPSQAVAKALPPVTPPQASPQPVAKALPPVTPPPQASPQPVAPPKAAAAAPERGASAPVRTFVPPATRQTPARVPSAAPPPAPPDVTVSVSAETLPGLSPVLESLNNPPAPPQNASAKGVSPPPAASPGARVSGKAEGARLLKQVLPEYPPLARMRRVLGVVTVESSIDEHGDVKAVKVLSGDPALSTAASAAVKQWKYKPATLNGQPVPSTIQVEVSFR